MFLPLSLSHVVYLSPIEMTHRDGIEFHVKMKNYSE